MNKPTLCSFLIVLIFLFLIDQINLGKAQDWMSLKEQIRWEKDAANMVLVPAGRSVIGDQLDGLAPNPVVVSFDGFYMDQTEITVGQFKQFVAETDYSFPMWEQVGQYSPTDDHPMTYVNWHDANAYAKWAGKRLPTEVEWEYAARGGLSGKRYPWGDQITQDHANYRDRDGIDQRGLGTSPVGQFPANSYGLFDMVGNVWEWCNSSAATTSRKVLRGGSWHSDSFDSRLAYSRQYPPTFRSLHFGFRCLAEYQETDEMIYSSTSKNNTENSAENEDSAGQKSRSEPPMVLIPSGTFSMGDSKNDSLSWLEKSRPVHEVVINSFYMDQTEVTVGQFRKFVVETGYEFTRWQEVEQYAPDDNYPMIYVTWYDASAYAKWSNKRLPTEAEWEYAARGGLSGKRYPWGDQLTADHANDKGTEGQDQWRKCSPVGQFSPNGYGLYDIAGNVWEWCSDWYEADYYSNAKEQEPSYNPIGANTGLYRILRGGSWLYNKDALSIAYRNLELPHSANAQVGFRCARDLPSEATDLLDTDDSTE